MKMNLKRMDFRNRLSDAICAIAVTCSLIILVGEMAPDSDRLTFLFGKTTAMLVLCLAGNRLQKIPEKQQGVTMDKTDVAILNRVKGLPWEVVHEDAVMVLLSCDEARMELARIIRDKRFHAEWKAGMI